MNSYTTPKVCIIGAGSSGLITSKKLKDQNIPHVCYEAGDQIGGNWTFKNTNQMSAAYRSLHINTSRKKMEFKCFPMPDHLPDFPHHSEIAKYFRDFADHFELWPNIKLNHKVTSTKRLDDGRWQVATDNGTTEIFDALIVANGHHWDPQMPEPAFPGNFTGHQIHSHQYVDPSEPVEAQGKNVVVVGMGNSAMDIACELGQRTVANKVFLSIRRSTHILPKFIFGKPIDSLLRHPGSKASWYEPLFPRFLVNKIILPLFSFVMNFVVGPNRRFGIPNPKHSFGRTHPTLSQDIHSRLITGDIIPKPNISRMDGDQVYFADGSCEKVDYIVYATGYKISFPFFSKNLINFSQNDLALFHRVFHHDYSNLMFIGLVQPLCSIMPIAEIQADWVSQYLLGHYKLPTTKQMQEQSRKDHQNMKKNYINSKRHTIQIDCLSYTRKLNKEIKAGYKRSKAMPVVNTDKLPANLKPQNSL